LTHRIACVFAHPDDETFCVGGTIAKYAAAGIRIDLFCATNGDAGKNSSVPVSSRE
jgi:LmbE family N-acetylglucosaminyl deacetylase